MYMLMCPLTVKPHEPCSCLGCLGSDPSHASKYIGDSAYIFPIRLSPKLSRYMTGDGARLGLTSACNLLHLLFACSRACSCVHERCCDNAAHMNLELRQVQV